MVKVNALVAAARSHLGVRYCHQGRTRKSGVDCIGLFVSCAKELGISVIDDTTYSREVDPYHLLGGLLIHCERTSKVDFSPGHLLLMQFSREAGATHVAMSTDKGIIHSYNKRGKVVEHRLNDVWKNRVVSSFKMNDVDYTKDTGDK